MQDEKSLIKRVSQEEQGLKICRKIHQINSAQPIIYRKRKERKMTVKCLSQTALECNT